MTIAAVSPLRPVSPQATWVGKWAGGRIRATAEGPKYVIEKMVAGHRYVVHLDVPSEARALLELKAFRADPVRYVDLHRGERETAPKASLWSDQTLDDWEKAKLAEGCTAEYVGSCRNYVEDWRKALNKRAIASLKLADLQRALKTWNGGRKFRIIALKSYTGWLRDQGLLKRAEDPSDSLAVPTSKATKSIEERSYRTEDLVTVYGRLESQACRDTFFLRATLGMHGTEVCRLAEGKGRLEVVEDPGGIYAVAVFPHKNGSAPRLSLSRRQYWAAKRLQDRGGAASSSTLYEALVKASKGLGAVIHAGSLRHNWATRALEEGQEIFPEGKKGLDRQAVAEQLGHSPATNKKYYSGVRIPPRRAIPLEDVLIHPDDPPTP